MQFEKILLKCSYSQNTHDPEYRNPKVTGKTAIRTNKEFHLGHKKEDYCAKSTVFLLVMKNEKN